jgi:hypothetical protein
MGERLIGDVIHRAAGALIVSPADSSQAGEDNIEAVAIYIERYIDQIIAAL